MKILHVGNPEAFKNIAVCKYFLARGAEIHFFSPSLPKNREPGIIYHYDSSGRPNKLSIFKNLLFLKRVVRRVDPDVVHAHNVYGYGWLAALSGFSPLVIHAYGGDVLPEQMEWTNFYRLWLSRYALMRAERLIVTGRHMRSTVVSHFGISSSKIAVISRGVDLDLFRPFCKEHRERLKSEFNLFTRGYIILSPRYLFNSVYNIDVVLKAVSIVRRKFRDVLLIQMNNHEHNEEAHLEILQLIHKLGIGENVLLLKNVPNNEMPGLYNISDLCISVPSSDGFPVTVLEASACKVPLIVSKLPYTSEWFEDGKNGLVIPEVDDSTLASAITDLLENPKGRKEFAEYNFRKVALEGDYRRCMAELAKVYKEVLQE